MLVYPPTPLGTQPVALTPPYGSLMVPLWFPCGWVMVPLWFPYTSLNQRQISPQNLEKHRKLQAEIDLGALSPARDALRSHQTM